MEKQIKRDNLILESLLSVVSWYFKKNGKNVSKTSLEFKVDRKQVRTWVAKEPSIRATKLKRDVKEAWQPSSLIWKTLAHRISKIEKGGTQQ